MIDASACVWRTAAARSSSIRLTWLPVVPDDVTTLNTSSSAMLDSRCVLNSPIGSRGTSATDATAAASYPVAPRMRAYGGHAARWCSVSSSRRSSMSASLRSCGRPYCGSSRTSSTRIALRQGGVVDLARAAGRQPLDRPHVERARVDAQQVGEVGADRPRVDRLVLDEEAHGVAAVDRRHRAEAPRGRLDLVEVHAQAEHLRDPRGTPGNDEVPVVVPPPEVAGAQLAGEVVAAREIGAVLGVAHHHVRPAVDELAVVDAQLAPRNRDPDGPR